jgi:hypothetical protein
MLAKSIIEKLGDKQRVGERHPAANRCCRRD